MLRSATVWAARLGSDDEGTKGSLVLWHDELVFTSDDGEVELRFPLRELGRPRRVRGSPVMVVEHGASGVAFYFVEPPPLRPGGNVIERRIARARSLAYLGQSNSMLRREVKSWVRGIRDASRDAR